MSAGESRTSTPRSTIRMYTSPISLVRKRSPEAPVDNTSRRTGFRVHPMLRCNPPVPLPELRRTEVLPPSIFECVRQAGTEREHPAQVRRLQFECWREQASESVGSKMSRLFHTTERADLVGAEEDVSRSQFRRRQLLESFPSL